jgi:hypothetical protein
MVWHVAVMVRRPSGILRIALTFVAIGLVTALMVTPPPPDAEVRGRAGRRAARGEALIVAPPDAPREITVGRARLLLKKGTRIKVTGPGHLDIGKLLRDGGGIPDDPEDVGPSGYQGVGCYGRKPWKGDGGEAEEGEGAEFSIGDLLEIFLQSGGLSVIMEGLSPRDILRINTPNGIIDARTASFGVDFEHLDTLVSVQYGSVSLSGYSGVPLIVSAGRQARLEGAAPPRIVLPEEDYVVPARAAPPEIPVEAYYPGSGTGLDRAPPPIERREPEVASTAEHVNPNPEGTEQRGMDPEHSAPQTIAPKPIDPVNPQPRSYP